MKDLQPKDRAKLARDVEIVLMLLAVVSGPITRDQAVLIASLIPAITGAPAEPDYAGHIDFIMRGAPAYEPDDAVGRMLRASWLDNWPRLRHYLDASSKETLVRGAVRLMQVRGPITPQDRLSLMNLARELDVDIGPAFADSGDDRPGGGLLASLSPLGASVTRALQDVAVIGGAMTPDQASAIAAVVAKLTGEAADPQAIAATAPPPGRGPALWLNDTTFRFPALLDGLDARGKHLLVRAATRIAASRGKIDFPTFVSIEALAECLSVPGQRRWTLQGMILDYDEFLQRRIENGAALWLALWLFLCLLCLPTMLIPSFPGFLVWVVGCLQWMPLTFLFHSGGMFDGLYVRLRRREFGRAIERWCTPGFVALGRVMPFVMIAAAGFFIVRWAGLS